MEGERLSWDRERRGRPQADRYPGCQDFILRESIATSQSEHACSQILEVKLKERVLQRPGQFRSEKQKPPYVSPESRDHKALF